MEAGLVICNLGINDNGEYIKEYTGGRTRGQFEGDCLALLDDYRKANPNVKFAIWTKLSPLAEGQKFYRSPEPFLMQADLEEVAKRIGAIGIDMQEPLRERMDEIFARDQTIPCVMMGLPKMNRPWEQYRAVQREGCDETGAIFVDTFAAGLGEMNDVHPRDKIPFAELAIGALK